MSQTPEDGAPNFLARDPLPLLLLLLLLLLLFLPSLLLLFLFPLFLLSLLLLFLVLPPISFSFCEHSASGNGICHLPKTRAGRASYILSTSSSSFLLGLLLVAHPRKLAQFRSAAGQSLQQSFPAAAQSLRDHHK